MSANKTDWSKVDAVIKSRDTSDLDKVYSDSQEVVPKSDLPSAMFTPEGILANFKKKQIERKVGIQLLRTFYEQQLDVVENQLKQGAHLKNKETLVEARKFLYELDRRQVEYFADFGLKNNDLRNQTMLKLGDQTSQVLKDLQEKDYPEEIRTEITKGVMKLHRDFFLKLTNELEEMEQKAK